MWMLDLDDAENSEMSVVAVWTTAPLQARIVVLDTSGIVFVILAAAATGHDKSPPTLAQFVSDAVSSVTPSSVAPYRRTSPAG
jgi:hypothetical protein